MTNFLNRVEIPLRWVDMDAYHHVNNAKYFDFMTEIRAKLFKAFKTSSMQYHFVVVDTHCNFKKSYVYPDTVVIEQYLEAVGHASFTLRYIFKSKSNPESIYADGMTKMVCYDPLKQKAVGLPQKILEILQEKR